MKHVAKKKGRNASEKYKNRRLNAFLNPFH